MYLDYTAEQAALRNQLREYFGRLMADETTESTDRAARRTQYRRIIRRLGAEGWLGIGWPEEYGGQGRSSIEQFIFFDEAQRCGVPVPTIALNTVGPTIMRFGTPEQKRDILGKILTGETDFSIGYTEPAAGTDLASLQTRAVREGDSYVVNGSKVFTTGAEISDFIWLAVRTDTGATKHRGISILMVPTAAPGFSVTPIHTFMSRTRPTTATYYENVRVPVGNLVGEENGGWRLITTQLNHERVAMAAYGGATLQLFDDVLAWAGSADSRGRRPVDRPEVRLLMARVHARLDAMKLLNWRMAWAVGRGDLAAGDASATKVYGTECVIAVTRMLLEVVAEAGYLVGDSDGAVLGGRLEAAYRQVVVGTFGGGNNDIQREIVASQGLGMPRAARVSEEKKGAPNP